jgi:hypothetical protein
MPLMPTRRDLVQAAALGIAAAPISAGQVRAMTSDGAALLARRLLLRDPDRSSVRLSPDGRSIAWREPRDGVLNLVVAPIEELARSRQITHFKDRPVSGYFVWASNNKYIVFFDTAGDQNYRAYSVDLDTGVEKPLTPAGGVRAYLQQRSARFPSEMLFGINARDRKLYDIVRINIATGESQPIFQNPGFRPIYTAADFTVRFGRRGLLGGAEEIQRWEPDGTWSSFVKIPADDVLTKGSTGSARTADPSSSSTREGAIPRRSRRSILRRARAACWPKTPRLISSWRPMIPSRTGLMLPCRLPPASAGT